jgi:hypothetical protein
MRYSNTLVLPGAAARTGKTQLAAGRYAASLAALLCCMISACSDSNGPSGEGSASVLSGEFVALTYNVAGLPEPISSSSPLANTPLISPLLNDYDLVLTQEDWETPDPNPIAPLRVYHELLKADAMHPHQSVPAPLPLGNDPSRPGALVSDGLNRFSQFPFGDITRQAWSGCDNNSGDCLAFKGFSVARTELAPGVCVDVYNLHGEAGNKDGDIALKEINTQDLVAFIAMYSDGRAIILGGDFNMRLSRSHDAANLDFLTSQTGLSDACIAQGVIDEEAIDKFFFRSNDMLTLVPSYCQFETATFVTPGGEPLSDHDPLAVAFSWSGSPDKSIECL